MEFNEDQPAAKNKHGFSPNRIAYDGWSQLEEESTYKLLPAFFVYMLQSKGGSNVDITTRLELYWQCVDKTPICNISIETYPRIKSDQTASRGNAHLNACSNILWDYFNIQNKKLNSQATRDYWVQFKRFLNAFFSPHIVNGSNENAQKPQWGWQLILSGKDEDVHHHLQTHAQIWQSFHFGSQNPSMRFKSAITHFLWNQLRRWNWENYFCSVPPRHGRSGKIKTQAKFILGTDCLCFSSAAIKQLLACVLFYFIGNRRKSTVYAESNSSRVSCV